MEYKINSGIWGNMFGIPNIIVDNFLKLANEIQIKVILYLLKNNGQNFNSEELALAIGSTSQEIDDAVLFWQQANIISNSENNFLPKSIFTPPSKTVEFSTSNTTVKTLLSANIKDDLQNTSSTCLKLTPTEISKIHNNSENIKTLFKLAENQLGTLNHTQHRSLIWMHDYLGLKVDVIVMLIAYCVSIQKSNTAYIDKIAVSWANNDINTLELAQDEVNAMTSYHNQISRIMRIFEMKRTPTTKQKEYIKKWNSKNLSDDMLQYAYELNLDNIDKFSFDYIDGIIKNWEENGITTLEQAQKANIEFKKKNKSKYNKVNKDDKKRESDKIAEKYEVFINKF